MKNGITEVIVNRQGIGFCSILFIILFLLKVGVVETVVVGWSWIWIFSPLWIPMAFFISILLIIGIGILIVLLGGFLISLICYIVEYITGKYKKNK